MVASRVTLGHVLESVAQRGCGWMCKACCAYQQDAAGPVRTDRSNHWLFQEEVFAAATVRLRNLDAFSPVRHSCCPTRPRSMRANLSSIVTHRISSSVRCAPMRNLVGEVVGRVEVYTDVN